MKKYYSIGAISLIGLSALVTVITFGVLKTGQNPEGNQLSGNPNDPRGSSVGFTPPDTGETISRFPLKTNPERISRDEIADVVKEKGLEFAWGLAKDAEGENYRFALEKEILKQWGILGNIDHGLKFLEENIGYGTRRENLVFALVYESPLNFAELLQLHEGASGEFVARGLLKGLEFKVMKDGVRPADIQGRNLTEEVKSALVSGMSIYASQRKTTGEVIAAIGEMSQLGLNSDRAIQGIVGRSSLSTLKEMFLASADATDPEINQLYSASAARLAFSAPEWFIQTVSEGGMQPGMDSLIEATIHLAEADSARAVEMLKKVGESNQHLHTGMAAGIATAAGKVGEFDTAREWIASIEDSSIKKSVENQLWTEERKVVARLAESNPLRALNEIQNGESIHPDYWIKEVFSVWLENSKNEALGWYEENRSSLKPEHNQHIARAYGELALTQGDINLARQWSEQVVDPKFKQKLVEQINAVVEKAQ